MSSSGNITWQDQSQPSRRVGWTNTFTGSQNPFYRADIRNVRDATTSADGLKRQVIYKPYKASYTGWSVREAASMNPQIYPSFWNAYRGARCRGYPLSLSSLINPSDPGNSFVSADNQAIERLYGQLQSFVQTVKSGEDFGEAKQTINAFRSPVPRIRKLLVDTLEGHEKALRRSIPQIPKALAEVYLEFNFGWAPLASTVAQAAVGLQNREEFAIYKPFKATGKSLSDDSKINTTASGPEGIVLRATGWRRAETSVVYKGVWKSSLPVDRRAVQDVLGLRPSNVIPTVWNLIPYSFLIDYVTNVGAIMESLNVPYDGVRWCCKTTRREYVAKFDITPEIPKFPNGVILESSSAPGQILTSLTSFSRRRQLLQPVPRPEFTGLRDMGGRQWNNVAALILARLPIINLLAKKVPRTPEFQQTFIRELGYGRRNKKEGVSFTFG